MILLKPNATDQEIIDAVWVWLTLLAQGNYQGACDWFADDARFRWEPRELERKIQRFFGGWRSRRPVSPSIELRDRVELHRFTPTEADLFTSQGTLPTPPVAHVGFFVPVERGAGIWTTVFLRPRSTAAAEPQLVFEFEIFHA